MTVFVMPGVLQCVPVVSNNDYKASCVLAFSAARTVDYNVGQLEVVQARFDTLFSGLYGDYGATDCRYLGCDVFDLNSATSQNLLYGSFTPFPGELGKSMGAQVSVLVSHKTNQRYKGGRPRNYLPYAGQSIAYSGDTILDGNLTIIQTGWNNLVSGMNVTDSGVGPQLFGAIRNRRHPTAAYFQLLNQSIVQDRFATQRRRLRKVNRHR